MTPLKKLRRWQAIAERHKSQTAEVDAVALREGADEIERLQAAVNQLRKTEDGEYIIPDREYWTLHFGQPIPWLCRASADYGDGRLFSTREAAEKARAGK